MSSEIAQRAALRIKVDADISPRLMLRRPKGDDSIKHLVGGFDGGAMKKKRKTAEQLFALDVRYIAKCLRAMREALQDALNVFTEKGQLVTAERREAWERALKLTDGDPRPKLPPGWMWAEVSVPESDLGPDFYDGRALALMDAAKCKATMTACMEYRLAAEQYHKERDEARSSMREMIGILEENIARRAGMVTPGGGNMHEAMLLAKWRKAAGMDTANAESEAPK